MTKPEVNFNEVTQVLTFKIPAVLITKLEGSIDDVLGVTTMAGYGVSKYTIVAQVSSREAVELPITVEVYDQLYLYFERRQNKTGI